MRRMVTRLISIVILCAAARAQGTYVVPDLIGKAPDEARTIVINTAPDEIQVRWLDGAFADFDVTPPTPAWMRVVWQYPKAGDRMTIRNGMAIVIAGPLRLLSRGTKVPGFGALRDAKAAYGALQPVFRIAPDMHLIGEEEWGQLIADPGRWGIRGTYPEPGDIVEPGSYVGVVIDTFDVLEDNSRMYFVLIIAFAVIATIIAVFGTKKSNLTTRPKKAAAGDGA